MRNTEPFSIIVNTPLRAPYATWSKRRSSSPLTVTVMRDEVVIRHRDLVNLYGCRIGAGTKIGAFVEIQKNASVGRRCKISSHTFICEGVTIEDNCFIGHSVAFINDAYPRATSDGKLQTEADWKVEKTIVRLVRTTSSSQAKPMAWKRPTCTGTWRK